MATITVNLTDTFDEWRIKTNSLGTKQGDLTTLSTTAKGTLVAAINEVFTNDSDDMENVVDDTSPELGGDLDVLTRSIVSSSNRNIAITPHGTGLAVITKGSFAGKLGSSLDVNDPRGMIAPTVMRPTRAETAVEMSEAEIRHLVQYWVSQHI